MSAKVLLETKRKHADVTSAIKESNGYHINDDDYHRVSNGNTYISGNK